MNNLTTRGRKFVYMAVVVALFVPIIALGRPSGGMGRSGGYIAQQRLKEDLGEATLGDVDPASSSLSLVLLGMRGVVATILWSKADEQKNMKQWSQLERTVESILLLQPHFQSVWKFQCWNLTYNVSAECDAVEDRFFWVKKGLIFLKRGVDRNRSIPELPHEVGDYSGKKIGRADERDFFRKFFVVDPDTAQFGGKPDPRVNPDGKDNYLVAREWYILANDTADLGKVQQHKMDGPLFYSYPYRSLMDYADAQQKDAATAVPARIEQLLRTDPDRWETEYRAWIDEHFTDAQEKWREAYREWTEIFGRRTFNTPVFMHLQIDGSDEELKKFAEQDGMTLEQKIMMRDRYQNTTQYRFWKLRCAVEAEDDMAEGHKLLILGKRKFFDQQDMDGTIKVLEDGLTRMERIFDKYRQPDGRNQLALDDEELADDVLRRLIIYRAARELAGNPVDETQPFPCKSLWTDPELQDEIASLMDLFQRVQGGAAAPK
jgi:hypothetical protein